MINNIPSIGLIYPSNNDITNTTIPIIKNVELDLNIFLFIVSGVNNAKIPRIRVKLEIFDPIIFPIATCPVPLIAENIDVDISGKDVANAASVSPKKKLLNL